MQEYSLKFIFGLILIVVNQPLGWFGIFLCAYCATKARKRTYYWLGSLLYGLSWIMMAAGIFLVGSEGMTLVKKLVTRNVAGSILLAAAVVIGVVWYVYVWKKKEKENIGVAEDQA